MKSSLISKEGLLRKIIVRIVYGVISVFLIMTITFFLFEILPGEIYSTETIKSEAVIQNIIAKYSLDKPIFERYIALLKNTMTFDFRDSYFSEGRTVTGLIANHFTVSATIGIMSLLTILLISIPFSIIIKERSKGYKTIYPLLALLISLPTFVIAVVLQYIFCVKLKIFPVLWNDSLEVYILPVISLSVYPIVFIARLLSSKMNDVTEEMYVLAAKARGISNITLQTRFVLRNSFVVVVSYLAPLCASLVVGSYAVESIFNIPGLGRYFVSSISNRDYPLVMGLTAFYAILLITINIASDSFADFLKYRGHANEI